jgi:hypothetical protein
MDTMCAKYREHFNLRLSRYAPLDPTLCELILLPFGMPLVAQPRGGHREIPQTLDSQRLFGEHMSRQAQKLSGCWPR